MTEKDKLRSTSGCTHTSRTKQIEVVDSNSNVRVTDAAYFCFPLDFDLIRTSDDVTTEAMWPQIVFTVMSRDSWEVIRIRYRLYALTFISDIPQLDTGISPFLQLQEVRQKRSTHGDQREGIREDIFLNLFSSLSK